MAIWKSSNSIVIPKSKDNDNERGIEWFLSNNLTHSQFLSSLNNLEMSHLEILEREDETGLKPTTVAILSIDSNKY